MNYRKLLFILLASVVLTGCESKTDTNTNIQVTDTSAPKEVIDLTPADNNGSMTSGDAMTEVAKNDEDAFKDDINNNENASDIENSRASEQAIASAADENINEENINDEDIDEAEPNDTLTQDNPADNVAIGESAVINWNESWTYADHSKIHSSPVTLYKSAAANRKNIIIAVNAGHGTKGGSSVKTLCHPDGSPKTTGGSTGQGMVEANAISEGMTFLNGTPESAVTLKLALNLKTILLNNGYDVLMLRETEDTQIDNVARTVYANNLANCHISLHYDSTENNKGFFVIGVPDIAAYKAMEPVASHYEQHNALASSIIAGAKANNIKLSGSGFQGIDLTQTSYSTIPSVDIEVGDKASDYSDNTLTTLSNGILTGLNNYFGF